MALVLAFGAVIVAVLTPLMPRFTKRLLRIAIRRLPEAQRERFSEEWASHIDEVTAEISKFAVALGCISAAREMASSLGSGLLRSQMKPAIALETVVEYRFLCFCGDPITATEKTVTCANCGKELRIRRFKRQHWIVTPPQRPHRRLQGEDLGALVNRIMPALLLGVCLFCAFYLLGQYLFGLGE
jgi:hypothetical protein